MRKTSRWMRALLAVAALAAAAEGGQTGYFGSGHEEGRAAEARREAV